LNSAIRYLEKHVPGYPLISRNPAPGLKYIVTIPAYLETSLTESLISLYSSIPPAAAVEVIIAVNWPENELPENIRLSKDVLNLTKTWINKHISDWISFHTIVLQDVPAKKAGVGYARKTAMDEAIRRFISARQEDGIIISFDADTVCDPDYFTRIESHFRQNPHTDGCTIYFEHPVEGTDFSKDVYLGISLYELHMRYFLHSLRYTGFPNAYYTLGSAFAIRARSYCRQGGMNIKKAGEDFYFLQKFFDLGSFTELNLTRVIPSPRPSDRVPFGTGASILSFIDGQQNLSSFNPSSFEALKTFFYKVPLLFKADEKRINHILDNLDISINIYLKSLNFEIILNEINGNSSEYLSFKKRFFRYFNMFRILKFLNFAKKIYPDIPVTEGAIIFLNKTGILKNGIPEVKALLNIFRSMDRMSISQR